MESLAMVIRSGTKVVVSEPVSVGGLCVTPEGDVLKIVRIWASLPSEAEAVPALDELGYPIYAENVSENTPAAYPIK